MKVFYTRVSTLSQNNDRQLAKTEGYYLIEDKCSGAIPFFERDGGRKIKRLLEKNEVDELCVHQIDRLGRNLMDILNTISVFSKEKVCVHFVQQGLKTLNEDKSENQIARMIISILGIVAEMERNLIKERQMEGIQIAKAKGLYKGRKSGTKLNNLDFLNKPKVKKALEFIDKGLKNNEVAKVSGLHPNTITKIKKIKNILEL